MYSILLAEILVLIDISIQLIIPKLNVQSMVSTQTKRTTRRKLFHRRNMDLTIHQSEAEIEYVVGLCSDEGGPYEQPGHSSCQCTGSLLNSLWVLTAAQCLGDNFTKIRFGVASDAIVTAVYSDILTKMPHPDYKHDVYDHNSNIGLAYIAPVVLDYYGRISKTHYMSMVGCHVKLVRFENVLTPDYRRVRQNPSNKKFVADANVVYCPHNIVGPYICVNSENIFLRSSRVGDVGAPLLHAGMIVGVACPAVEGTTEMQHTPVSPHYDWILSITNYDYERAMKKEAARSGSNSLGVNY